MSLDRLRPLTKCQALVELEVGGSLIFSQGDLAALFGEAVAVTVRVNGK
ncbi:MAG: hypothetical protein ACJAYX_004914 [Planctomycetota bacterium]|jgi:hypothetical protein